jgi:hypothetical protein
MSMLAKKKEQERRERVRRELELGRSMPPMRQPMPGQAPMRPPPRVQQQAPPRPPPQRQQVPPRQAPPRVQPQQPKKRFPAKAPSMRRKPQPVQEEAATVLIEAEAVNRITSPPQRRTASPVAAALHGWLKPSTLRKQFILTEVLQPPVAMREDRF